MYINDSKQSKLVEDRKTAFDRTGGESSSKFINDFARYRTTPGPFQTIRGASKTRATSTFGLDSNNKRNLDDIIIIIV